MERSRSHEDLCEVHALLYSGLGWDELSVPCFGRFIRTSRGNHWTGGWPITKLDQWREQNTKKLSEIDFKSSSTWPVTLLTDCQRRKPGGYPITASLLQMAATNKSKSQFSRLVTISCYFYLTDITMTTIYCVCRDLMVADDSRNMWPSWTVSVNKVNSILFILLQYIWKSNYFY